ncbi:MAG: ABC transporter permease subunit [Saprospiraceae bacterium]|nr:ABC transporter permease subunit [Saprospiraceae bacterium]
MLHLLKLEWLKQKDYVLFRVLSIAYVVLLPAALVVGKKMDLGKDAPFNPQTQFFHFPTVWNWLGYIGNWMVFFVLGFMAVLMITNEYSNRTLRQNVITGLHRDEFFKSKLIFMVVVALAATLYYALCAVVIGLLHVDDTLYFSTVFKNVDMVPRYWLMSMGYMSFGLLIGLLVKRTGIALFLYLAYAMVIESILRWVVHLYFFKNASMNFYPLNAMEDLAPLPVAEFADDLLKQNGFRMLLTPMEAVVASVIYTSLFLFLSYRRLKNSDL